MYNKGRIKGIVEDWFCKKMSMTISDKKLNKLVDRITENDDTIMTFDIGMPACPKCYKLMSVESFKCECGEIYKN